MQFISRSEGLIPSRICTSLIDLFKDAQKRKLTTPGMTGTRIDKKRKDSVDLHSARIPKKLHEKYAETIQGYFERLIQAHQEYLERFPALKHPKTFEHGVYFFNIQRYYPGGQAYHSWHYENAHPDVAHRLLAWMTYLNTVKVGGETEFLHQGIKIAPREGLTLIWPAGFTHTHRGLPQPDEVKFIITGWFEFAPRGVSPR